MEGQLVHPCIELSEELRQSLTPSYDEQIAWQPRAYPTHQHQVTLEHVSGIGEVGFISTQRQIVYKFSTLMTRLAKPIHI